MALGNRPGLFANILLNYYANTHPFAGQTMGRVSAKYPTLLTPAGYAFSIWGLIFLALAVYAVWQLLPAQQTKSLPDAVAKPLTLASLATGAWVVLFAYEMILPSVGVMLLILGCLIATYGRVRRRIFAEAAPAAVGVLFRCTWGGFRWLRSSTSPLGCGTWAGNRRRNLGSANAGANFYSGASGSDNQPGIPGCGVSAGGGLGRW